MRFGYACVHQDVRGHGKSEGDWYPLKHEAADGSETLRWLVGQPWQNGNIATVGASYVGLVQWALAGQLPPEVKTIVTQVSHGDFYRMVYRGGHFTQAIAGLWAAEIYYPLEEKATAAEIWENEVRPARPALGVNPAVFKGAWASYKDYISHPERSDPYWQQPFYENMRTAHTRLEVPAFLIARWHDFFLAGMLDVFDELPRRDESLLMISPGEHAGQVNDLPVGDRKSMEFRNMLYWLDHHLKGKSLPEHLSNRVLYYKNRADTWESAASWPQGPAEPEQLYLDQHASAASCGGHLQQNKPAPQQASYRYDPLDPVPTKGGAFLLNPNLAPIAVADQGTDVCARADVLSFISAPLNRARRMAGAIKVTFNVSSDAEDTAFTVKLSEVLPDGRVLNIRDDITSLSFRNGADSRQLYEPDTRIPLRFQLPPIDWTLQAGSALRLDVSSSNAPAFPPHSNYAGLWSEISEVRQAQQTLYQGGGSLPFVD